MERMLQAEPGMTFQQVRDLAGVRQWHYFTDGRGPEVHLCVGYSLVAHQPDGGTKAAHFFYLFRAGRLWKVVGGSDRTNRALADGRPTFSYGAVTQMIDEMTGRPGLTAEQVRRTVEAQRWISRDLDRWLTIVYAFGAPFWGPGYIYDQCQVDAIPHRYDPLRVCPGQTPEDVEKVFGPSTGQGTEKLANGGTVESRLYVPPKYQGSAVASSVVVWFTGGRAVIVTSNTFVGP